MKTSKDYKQQVYSKLLHGIQCPNCEEILVSLHLHDFRQCGCKENKTFIDGGQDPNGYCRVGGADLSKIKHVKIRVSTGYGI